MTACLAAALVPRRWGTRSRWPSSSCSSRSTSELLLISETLGILCAGLHRNELVGMIILATFYVPLLMFTGFIQVRCCLPPGFH